MVPETLQSQLASYGIADFSEVALREALEIYVPTYTLIRLADWPARRWKCRYRLMRGDVFHDAQTVPEAYALALLAALSENTPPQSSPTNAETNEYQR